jgi:N-acetylglutamate synthase-like GNAT family acetyltransferase
LEFNLRSARRIDSTSIRQLIHQAGINPTGLAWQRFLLAVDDQDQMIGCVQLKHHGDGSIEMASLAVIPELRGQGVARALIETILASAPDVPIYLTCRSGLGPFYRRFGFTAIDDGEMPAYFRRINCLVKFLGKLRLMPESLLVMRKDIEK